MRPCSLTLCFQGGKQAAKPQAKPMLVMSAAAEAMKVWGWVCFLCLGSSQQEEGRELRGFRTVSDKLSEQNLPPWDSGKIMASKRQHHLQWPGSVFLGASRILVAE